MMKRNNNTNERIWNYLCDRFIRRRWKSFLDSKFRESRERLKEMEWTNEWFVWDFKIWIINVEKGEDLLGSDKEQLNSEWKKRGRNCFFFGGGLEFESAAKRMLVGKKGDVDSIMGEHTTHGWLTTPKLFSFIIVIRLAAFLLYFHL